MKPTKTAADYAAIAVAPVLIFLMISSLANFLTLTLYRGGFTGRLSWILLMFTMGAVGIARIAIEQNRNYSYGYLAALSLVTFFAMLRFVDSVIFAALILGVIAYLADVIVRDCTLIDEDVDASGQGLVDSGRLYVREQMQSETESEVESEKTSKTRKKTKTHQPGRTVLYLALGALPLFGLGQFFLRNDTETWARAQRLLAFYLFSSLSLLVTTSFLGLRRYLRQRSVDMPTDVSIGWMGGGVAMIATVLLLAYMAPMPGRALATFDAPLQLDSPGTTTASRFGWGDEGADKSRPDAPKTLDPDQDKQQDGQTSQRGAPEGNVSDGQRDKGPAGKQGGGKQKSSSSSPQGKQQSSGQDGQKSKSQSASQKSQASGEKASSKSQSGQSGQDKSNDNGGQQRQDGKKQSQRQSAQQQNQGSKNSSEQQSGSKSEKARSNSKSPQKDSQSNQGNDRPNQSSDSESSQGSKAEDQQNDSANSDARDDNRKDPEEKGGDDSAESQSESQSGDQDSSQSESSQQDQDRKSDSSSGSQSDGASESQTRSVSESIVGTMGAIARLIKFLIIVGLAVVVCAFVWMNRELIRQWWESLFAIESEDEQKTQDGFIEEITHVPPRAFASFQNPIGKESDQRRVLVITFQAFEAWSREHGTARERDETPTEFLRRATNATPQISRPATQIVDAYNRIVYGRGKPTKNDLHAAEQAWQLMRSS